MSVVQNHFGPLPRELQSNAAADTGARPCHEGLASKVKMWTPTPLRLEKAALTRKKPASTGGNTTEGPELGANACYGPSPKIGGMWGNMHHESTSLTLQRVG